MQLMERLDGFSVLINERYINGAWFGGIQEFFCCEGGGGGYII